MYFFFGSLNFSALTSTNNGTILGAFLYTIPLDPSKVKNILVCLEQVYVLTILGQVEKYKNWFFSYGLFLCGTVGDKYSDIQIYLDKYNHSY